MTAFLTCFVLPPTWLFCTLATTTASPKVVSMPFTKSTRAPALSRRASTFPVTLGNAERPGLYYVNASVGTPPQTVQLQIDTGSSDVWMFGPKSCDSTTSLCLGGASTPNFVADIESTPVNPAKSTSATSIAPGLFAIQYVTPGSGVQGDYWGDNFGIGGVVVQNLTLAVATQAVHVTTGIMGIGFDSHESSVQFGVTYPNIIDEMVTQGLIKTRAYSLWLDDLQADTGTILFGGYDSGKYSGQLALLPLQVNAVTNVVDTLAVVWSSIALTDSSGSTLLVTNDVPAAAVLDSGTTKTIVPPNTFAQLATYFGVFNDTTYGYIVNCNISSIPGTIDYGFGGQGGPVISVPFSELALPFTDATGNLVNLTSGGTACHFGFHVNNQADVPNLFGDTFLRSAYVVYDLDNTQIGIAPTIFGSTKSNVQEIGAGNLAGVSSIASGISVKQTATGQLAPGIGQTINTGTAASTVAGTSVNGGDGFGSLSGVATSRTNAIPSASGQAVASSAPAAASTGQVTEASGTAASVLATTRTNAVPSAVGQAVTTSAQAAASTVQVTETSATAASVLATTISKAAAATWPALEPAVAALVAGAVALALQL